MHTQHIDLNVGPANYAHLADNQLLVTSIFYTIQGEGPFAGCPAVFVRLAGCNRGRKVGMGCEFCDTKFFHDQGSVMSFDQILQRIIQLSPKLQNVHMQPMIVITGGEPMLQDNLTEFLVHVRYHEPKRSIQVESNGDRLARHWNTLGHSVSLVVSPKVVGNKTRQVKPDVMAALTCLKFVISADKDSPYHYVPQWARDNKASDYIFVSPMTMYKRDVNDGEVACAWDSSLIDYEATRRNYYHAASLSLAHGYRMSIQQHLFYGLE